MATTFKTYLDKVTSWGGKHFSLVKGFVALFAGAVFIYVSRDLFAKMLIFGLGLLLIYYALYELKLRKVTDFVDKMVGKLKR